MRVRTRAALRSNCRTRCSACVSTAAHARSHAARKYASTVCCDSADVRRVRVGVRHCGEPEPEPDAEPDAEPEPEAEPAARAFRR